ncbi:MAG: glycosyltransferase family 2 protein [Isosphaeraceae bacterium]
MISVVVPLFNEQENIAALYRRIHEAIGLLNVSHEILFVNDGSRDETGRMIDQLHEIDPAVSVVHLSRNFGHQCAVSAGIDHARGLAVIVMDGDLQDPPEVIPEFVNCWRQGNDVVYAVRHQRKENVFKRVGYFSFYRLLKSISDLDIPLDSGDFCLMDRRVIEAIKALPERARFIRGLRTFVGFRQVGLAYERAAREGGKSSYSFRALLKLALDGLVSFSSYPLRIVTFTGITIACLALLLTVWVFIDAFYTRTGPRGWASTIVVVLFMGSIQLVGLGVVGEYVRLIFQEAKERPTYVVEAYKVRENVEAARMNFDGHDTRHEQNQAGSQRSVMART